MDAPWSVRRAAVDCRTFLLQGRPGSLLCVLVMPSVKFIAITPGVCPQVGLTPLVLVLSLFYVAAPCWNVLRRRLPESFWDKVRAPAKATQTHERRALLSVYLFCYTPLTQAAVEMLVCVPTCSDNIGPTQCHDVMNIDYGAPPVELAKLLLWCHTPLPLQWP